MPETISVVTICFNNLEELRTTCASVDLQDLPPFEHLIIDGSTDGEIAAYLSETPQPAYRRWLCERDKGIADAFNKGARMASGALLNFLNSGDSYYDTSTLRRVTQAFERQPSLQWLHGGFVFFRGGIWLQAGTPFGMRLLYRGMRQVSHQSMFVRKGLFEKYGYFSLEKKVAMDYDWLVRMAHEPSTYIGHPLCKFVPDGASYQNVWKGLTEVMESHDRYRGFSLWQRLWMWRTYLLFLFTQRTWLGKALFQWKNRGKKI